MSDIVTQDSPDTRKSSRFLSILILVSLFVPHSLGISHVNLPDNSYIRYSVYAVFWAISFENGSTIAGPYSSTFFEFLSVPTLLIGALFIPLFIAVIITQSRFIKGITTKRSILRVIGLALMMQIFPLSALFWYQVTGLVYAQLFPIPIFLTLNVLSVVRQRETDSKYPSSGSNSSILGIVSNVVITSCFWVVSLVFFMIGGLMVISNLFLSVVFLGLGISIIIVWTKSKYSE